MQRNKIVDVRSRVSSNGCRFDRARKGEDHPGSSTGSFATALASAAGFRSLTTADSFFSISTSFCLLPFSSCSSTICVLLPGSALALLLVKNFFRADRLVRFFSTGRTVGAEPCRKREGSLGAVEVLADPRGGEDTEGRAVILIDETLILSDCRSCSTATIDGRLVIEDEGKIPSAPIAGGRGLGDVVGRESVGSTSVGGEKCVTVTRRGDSATATALGCASATAARIRASAVPGCSWIATASTAGGEKYLTTGSGLDA